MVALLNQLPNNVSGIQDFSEPLGFIVAEHQFQMSSFLTTTPEDAGQAVFYGLICPVDTTSAKEGWEPCTPCPYGSFNPVPGNAFCVPCHVGTYGSRTFDEGPACVPCPAGYSTSATGVGRDCVDAETCCVECELLVPLGLGGEPCAEVIIDVQTTIAESTAPETQALGTTQPPTSTALVSETTRAIMQTTTPAPQIARPPCGVRATPLSHPLCWLDSARVLFALHDFSAMLPT